MKNREPRPKKETDNDDIEKAIDLIYELMECNPSIEPTLWSSAVTYVLINGYKQSGYSYKEFRKEISTAFDHYEHIFNE